MSTVPETMPSVLFVCVHNAGRSQIAAALLSHYAGDAVEVRSAGSLPSYEVPDVVVDALADRGNDLADACPIYPGKHYLDWELAVPEEGTPDRVRAIVDEVDGHVRGLWETIQR